MLLLLLLLLSLLSTASPSTAYSSQSDLQALYKIEDKLLTLLDQYIAQQVGQYYRAQLQVGQYYRAQQIRPIKYHPHILIYV